MGGSHVALADDYSVLLANPAGLADVPQQVSVADLGIQAIGPVFDIANLLVSGATSTTAIVNFLAANDYKLYAGLDIPGPLASAIPAGAWASDSSTKTSMNVDVASASSIDVDGERRTCCSPAATRCTSTSAMATSFPRA